MNLDIFSGLPRYVRLTVYTQIRRLLTTGLFNYEDQEDIAQDLLLFYLKKFYEVPDVDEALVVHALKQYASVMIRTRYRRRDYLHSSIEERELDEECSFFKQDNNFDARSDVLRIYAQCNEKERKIVQLIMDGETIAEISRKLGTHKQIIYRFLKKMKKFLQDV